MLACPNNLTFFPSPRYSCIVFEQGGGWVPLFNSYLGSSARGLCRIRSNVQCTWRELIFLASCPSSVGSVGLRSRTSQPDALQNRASRNTKITREELLEVTAALHSINRTEQPCRSVPSMPKHSTTLLFTTGALAWCKQLHHCSPYFCKGKSFCVVWRDFCQACNATKMRFSNQHLFFCRFFKYWLLLVLPYPQHDSPTMHQILFKYSLRCQNFLVPWLCEDHDDVATAGHHHHHHRHCFQPLQPHCNAPNQRGVAY